MRNRRAFIKTVAGVTAGALVMGRELVSAQGRGGGRGAPGQGRGGAAAGPPTGPVQRRIVQVGGRRVRVVDVHSHVTVPDVGPVVAGTEFARDAGGGRAMGDERIWEMDKRGIGSHGGGYLPSYLGRTDVACQVRPSANCANKKQPAEYFKDQLIVDAMVFSPEDVRHLVAKSGPTQVVYGTDIPIYQWPDAVDNILQADIPDAQKEMILGGNLAKLLKLEPFQA